MTEWTPARWQQVSSLLDQVLDLDTGERSAWLQREVLDPELRSEISRLLAHAESTGGHLDRGAADMLVSLEADPPGADLTPWEALVGPYRLVREVGRGGMGVVYEATRADGQFENRVALKLVRPGFDSRDVVRRFERERRILARLEHPAIARILDGGLSPEGRPYFAMEFVDGQSILTYSDQHSLSLDERIGLVIRACDAVQYAHGRLIVHRDLKPSNILVTEDGELKLVDFGIAKVLSADEATGSPGETAEPAELTQTRGNALFTPAYAAPEQLSGDPVTTATDVFSLGLVLYELLAGQRPFSSRGEREGRRDRGDLDLCSSSFRRAPPALAHSVAEARGTTPAGLARRLEGDLDAITAKALAEDPSGRYPSALALREDLERHLDHRPITARRQSTVLRAGRFVRRHRIALAVASVLGLSIAVGVAATVWQAQKKTLQAEKARRITDFVLELFQAADPARAQGEDVTAKELVDQGATRLEQELAGQPEVQAEMGLVLGRINDRLGRSEVALELLDRSLERSQAGPGRSSRTVSSKDMARIRADALRTKGAALVHLGRAGEAEPVLREALEEHRRLQRGRFDRDSAASRTLALAEDLDELSIALHDLGRLEESEQAILEGFRTRLLVLAADDPRIASSYNNLAVIQRELGRLDEAEVNYGKALEIRIPTLGLNHPETADTLNNLAALLHYRGRYGVAAQRFEEVSEIYRDLYGDQHPRTITAANNLAVTLLKLGDLAGAEELLEQVYAYWTLTHSDLHPNALITKGTMALLYQSRGELARAEKTAREVVRDLRSSFGDGHPLVGIFQLRIASVEREMGNLRAAEDLAAEAHGVLEKVYGSEHAHVALALEELGRVETERGEPDSALIHLGRALDLRLAQLGGEAIETLSARNAVAAALREKGQLTESEAQLATSVEIGRRVLPADHPLLFSSLLESARTAERLGKEDEARQLAYEAASIGVKRFGPKDRRTLSAELILRGLDRN